MYSSLKNYLHLCIFLFIDTYSFIYRDDRCAPNWTNMGFFRSYFSTFWLGEPKCTETDLKKSQICPIWGQSDPIWIPNLTPLIACVDRDENLLDNASDRRMPTSPWFRSLIMCKACQEACGKSRECKWPSTCLIFHELFNFSQPMTFAFVKCVSLIYLPFQITMRC